MSRVIRKSNLVVRTTSLNEVRAIVEQDEKGHVDFRIESGTQWVEMKAWHGYKKNALIEFFKNIVQELEKAPPQDNA